MACPSPCPLNSIVQVAQGSHELMFVLLAIRPPVMHNADAVMTAELSSIPTPTLKCAPEGENIQRICRRGHVKRDLAFHLLCILKARQVVHDDDGRWLLHQVNACCQLLDITQRLQVSDTTEVTPDSEPIYLTSLKW